MPSIPHSQRARTPKPTNSSVRGAEPLSDAAGDRLRGFFYDTRHAVMYGDYLLRKWLPILGPELFTLLKVLRSMCYFNPETGELRDECWPSYETLAAKCGVGRATIGRWLKRDASGQFLWTQKNAAGKTVWVWSPLNLFLKVKQQTRYSHQHQSRVQSSNRYLVALDDPLTPEDAEALQQQPPTLTMIQARKAGDETPVNGTQERVIAEDSESQNETPRAVSKRDPQSSLTMSRKVVPLSNTLKNDVDRTKGERLLAREKRPPAEETSPFLPKKALGGGQRAASTAAEPPTGTPLQPGKRPLPPRERKTLSTPLRARDQAQARAEQHIGAELVTLLREQLGASNPDGGTQTILRALVKVGAPLDCMADLVCLGHTRLRQQLALGNPIENQAGYFISIMRDLAQEALIKRWDTVQIAQEDEARYAQALRSAAARAGQAMQVKLEEEGPGSERAVDVPRSEPPAQDVLPADASPVRPDLPEGVELVERAAFASLSDTIPDPQTHQARALSMLWGFVREALQAQLNLQRQQHLAHLTPKWDATRPRTLLLLSTTPYTARFVAQVLRREIEAQLGKLLSLYFDEFQIAYAPEQEG